MKHMDRTSIFPNSFLSAHWKVVRMPARRVSTKRRVLLHRAPYHWFRIVSMRQEVTLNPQMAWYTPSSYLLMASLDAARRGWRCTEEEWNALELARRARDGKDQSELKFLGPRWKERAAYGRSIRRVLYSRQENLRASITICRCVCTRNARVSTEFSRRGERGLRYYLGKQSEEDITRSITRWQEFRQQRAGKRRGGRSLQKAVAVPRPPGDGKDTARGIFCGEGSRSVCKSGRTNCSRDGSPISAGNPRSSARASGTAEKCWN